MERMDAGGNPGGSRGEPASSQKELELSRPFHAFLTLSPISYGPLLFHIPKLPAEQWFYWNVTYTQSSGQVLSPGEQPVEPNLLPPPGTCPGHTSLCPGAAGRSHQHPNLCTLPPFRKLTGIHRHQKLNSLPSSREDRSNPSSLKQNEEETNTDLFCL